HPLHVGREDRHGHDSSSFARPVTVGRGTPTPTAAHAAPPPGPRRPPRPGQGRRPPPVRSPAFEGATMRIGVSGGGARVDRGVSQAVEAAGAGLTSLWYPGSMFGDPLIAMALAGRATSTVEIGVAVLTMFGCHPVLQATRAASLSAATNRGVSLAFGPSH